MIEKEFMLDSQGVTLCGTVVLPAGEGPWPLSVLCHGIPSGVPAPGEAGYEVMASRLAAQGSAACYFNFRGTGLSGGDFSLAGWAADLEALLAAVRSGGGAFEGCDPARLVLMGFSGGGAVCIICAARENGLAGMVSLSSPADFSNLITREGMGDFIAHARAIGIIRDPAFPPSEDDYYREMMTCNPVDFVGGVAPTPLLVIHGDSDETVPVSEAHKLYAAASQPKELFIVEGGAHKLRLDTTAMEKAVSWTLERLGSAPDM